MTIVNCGRFSPLREAVSRDGYGYELLTRDRERNKVNLITDLKAWFLKCLNALALRMRGLKTLGSSS